MTAPQVSQVSDWPDLTFPWRSLLLLAAITGGLLWLTLSHGTVDLPFASVASALIGADTGVASSIVVGFRLPRSLTAMLAGAALAVSGLLMQTLLRNPLAGPWMLGVTAGARLGVALLLTLGAVFGLRLATTLGPLAGSAMAIAACVGAAATLAAIAAVSRRVSPVTMLIIGLLFTYVADSAAMLLVTLSPLAHKAIFTAWNDGSFDQVTWPQLGVFGPVVILGVLLAMALAKALDALILGERYARTLGHGVARVRLLVVVTLVVLAGCTTAFCGPLAFIDLAAPHLARVWLRTASHRTLLPATALVGMSLALAADLTLSLPAAQQVLHVNYVTAVIGGPIVLWLLVRRGYDERVA
jgi:iron complex transport system permease protein